MRFYNKKEEAADSGKIWPLASTLHKNHAVHDYVLFKNNLLHWRKRGAGTV